MVFGSFDDAFAVWYNSRGYDALVVLLRPDNHT